MINRIAQETMVFISLSIMNSAYKEIYNHELECEYLPMSQNERW